MQICIMGHDRTPQMTELERLAHARGAKAQFATLDGSFAPWAFGAAGVVIFENGCNSVIEWVARVRAYTPYLHLPVIVVAGSASRESRNRLLAAGVAAVCEPDTSPEHIFLTMKKQCDNQVVFDDVQKNLLEPFVTATYITMRELANTEVALCSTYKKTNYKTFGDIAAVIGFMAPCEGTMVISFPDVTAAAIVGRVLAGVTDNPDTDMIRDGVGEIANVIAGQAKGILCGTAYHFNFTTPTIVGGQGHEIRHKPGTPCLVLAFESDVGAFALQLCLQVAPLPCTTPVAGGTS